MVDLKKIASSLKKNYKSSAIAEDISDPKDFISTGNLAFDLISDGGIPFGLLTEFLGLSRSGKSLFIQQIIANAQKKFNAVGVLVDRENAYIKKRGEELGVDNKNLLVVKPRDIPLVPDAFKFIIESIKNIREEDKKAYIVIAVDSIAAFDKDVALEKADPGRKAKAVHEGLRKIFPIIDERIALIVANQVTFKINVMFGDPKTSTVGESMKYYSALRFALEDRKQIVDEIKGGEVIGNWLKIEAIKTRLGPCFRTCYIPAFYVGGTSWYGGYARLLAARNYLQPKNKDEFKSFRQKMLTFGDEEVNEFEVEKFLKKHSELLFGVYPEYKQEPKKMEVENVTKGRKKGKKEEQQMDEGIGEETD